MDIDALKKLGGDCLLHGEFDKSVWALDAALCTSPCMQNSTLWQRGLACVYRGQYDNATLQFEENMTENGSDIEEVIWHFISRAKKLGFDEAKQDGFLKLRSSENDYSMLPPMPEILKLYKGECSVEDVVSSAVDENGRPLQSYNSTSALAYAYFYIGIFYELRNEINQAKEFLEKASDFKNPDFIGLLMTTHYRLFSKKLMKIPLFMIGTGSKNSYSCSQLIQGGWQLSTGHVINKQNETTSLTITHLLRAYDAGIHSFDCGDIYSGVEALYGKFINALRQRDGQVVDVHVHTKFVPDMDVIRRGGVDAKYVRSCVRRSLNRLGIDCVSLVQCYWWDWSVPGYLEAFTALHQCLKDGLVRQLGVTNMDTETTRQVLNSGIPIATTQVQFSLLDRRPLSSGLVSLCKEHGIKILAYGVLAGGFLTDAWLGSSCPQVEDLSNRSLVKYLLIIDEFGGWEHFQKLLHSLRSIADRHGLGTSIAMVAIQYVLTQQEVGGVIIGAHDSRHLSSSVSATCLELLPEDLADIEGILALSKGPTGPVYGLERDVTGVHGKIMKYTLSKLNTAEHLEELCHRYLELHFSAYPTEATRTGYRSPPPPSTDDYACTARLATSYDHLLDIVSPTDIEVHCKRMQNLLEEAEAIDRETLSKEQLVDLELIISQLKLQFVIFQRVESHKKDPSVYLPLNGVLYLLPVWGDEAENSKFDLEGHTHPGVADMSVDERLFALLSRLRVIPSVLIRACQNLTLPVKAFVKTALKICDSFVVFLSSELVPLCRSMDTDSKDMLEEIKLASEIAAKCVENFKDFLSSEILPKSSDVAGVGKEVYSEILRYSHFIESSEELLALGESHFEAVKSEMAELAKKIDPCKTWQEITRTLINPLHPSAANLLSSYMAEIQRARDHMISHDLVSDLPPDERVRGFTTPSFLTPFSPFGDYLNPSPFAGMSNSSPPKRIGHLMLHSVSARPPDSHQTLLRGHDYCWISVISPHESYPGHHVQALLAQTNPRVLRKYHESILFYEGWGLYTEQLAYETGFFKQELEYLEEDTNRRKTLSSERFEQLARLTQLRLRLWRAARVILDAKLNLGVMSVEDCREFLIREVMFNEGASEGEVFMYISRPGYAPCYVAGYVMFMQLREEMRRQEGAEFSLKAFHDKVLSKGCIPFKLLRTLL